MLTNEIIIYTDGASLGNPGPGGWAAVIIEGKERTKKSGGYRWTTNNRMELLAVIESLRSLKVMKGQKVKILTDSRLIVDAVGKKWLEKWESNYWWRGTAGKKEKVLNKDLWLDLLPLLSIMDVKFEWVKGHAGDKNNELCDKLSKEAALGAELNLDIEYESLNPCPPNLIRNAALKSKNILLEEILNISETYYKLRLIKSSDNKNYIELSQDSGEKHNKLIFKGNEFYKLASFILEYTEKLKSLEKEFKKVNKKNIKDGKEIISSTGYKKFIL